MVKASRWSTTTPWILEETEREDKQVKEHLVHFIYKYILVRVKLMDLIELTVGWYGSGEHSCGARRICTPLAACLLWRSYATSNTPGPYAWGEILRSLELGTVLGFCKVAGSGYGIFPIYTFLILFVLETIQHLHRTLNTIGSKRTVEMELSVAESMATTWIRSALFP
jgi:hypothetical protein